MSKTIKGVGITFTVNGERMPINGLGMQPDWDSPTGLPYIGGTIGEWSDHNGLPLRRYVGSEEVACAQGQGAWSVYDDNPNTKSLSKGQVSTLEAAKKAADRALLREVLRCCGWNGNSDSYTLTGGARKVTLTGAQVREILEGAAGAGPCGECQDYSEPVGDLGLYKCSMCGTDTEPPWKEAPAITDAQLSEIVTGLPLGGGVIGARIGQNATRSCWRRHLCSRGVTVYQGDKGRGSEWMPSIADADRQLLTWALEEARDEGLLGYGRDRHGDYVTIAALGGRSVTRRMLADLRAALPDFDWAGVPGYDAPPFSLIELAQSNLRKHGLGRCAEPVVSERVGEILRKAAPSPAGTVVVRDTIKPEPFDPWPLTPREVQNLTATTLNFRGDFAPAVVLDVREVLSDARSIARALFHFAPLDTTGRDAWWSTEGANMFAMWHVLASADWRHRADINNRPRLPSL